jgi:hypothetical protein
MKPGTRVRNEEGEVGVVRRTAPNGNVRVSYPGESWTRSESPDGLKVVRSSVKEKTRHKWVDLAIMNPADKRTADDTWLEVYWCPRCGAVKNIVGLNGERTFYHKVGSYRELVNEPRCWR